MAKFSGLNLAKPKFEWDCRDRLIELEHFKEDCRILFEGPLADMKDKPKAGLIINWLGREAAQVLKSMEVEADKPDEVFEALEKIFRPESNQTLVRFRFRSMKQTQHQSIDDYMSKLRLALPDCKYKNDADELLKDQFLFGVHNKEIQDHLLGEISEVDKSMKALYEARKIESKHKQHKLLGTVNPSSLTSIDAIKAQKFSRRKDCNFCGQSHKRGKQNCSAFGKTCDKCGEKNHFKNVCKSSKSGSSSRHGSDRDRSCRTKGKCTHRCDIHEVDCCDDSSENCTDNTDMNDLTEQVQSLFYH